MPRPRVRYDETGKALPCKVFIPPHLARYLYREALKARKGGTALQVEETDIVVKLVEEWAKGLPPMDDWQATVNELKAEADLGADEEKKGRGKSKKPKPS